MKQYLKQILIICLAASLLGNAYLYSKMADSQSKAVQLSEQLTAQNDEAKLQLVNLEELSAKYSDSTKAMENKISDLEKQLEDYSKKNAELEKIKAANASAEKEKPIVPETPATPPQKPSSSTPTVPSKPKDPPPTQNGKDNVWTDTPTSPQPAPLEPGGEWCWFYGQGWLYSPPRTGDREIDIPGNGHDDGTRDPNWTFG